MSEYAIQLRKLSKDDGGGWLAEVPDLPGCMSDGETRAEAVHNAKDAIKAWKYTARSAGMEIPKPTTSGSKASA